jgi:hypothetical protein
MSLRSAFFSLAPSFALFACSSSSSAPAGQPPVIDSVDAPATATQSNGAYAITATVAFHDPNKAAITKVRLEIPAANLDTSQDVRNANPAAVSAQVLFAISGSAPKQSYNYSISVIDATGAESAAVEKSITLE